MMPAINDMPMIIAIDPGLGGGFASGLFNPVTHELHMVRVSKMPETTEITNKLLAYWTENRAKVVSFIENITVQGPPKPGESQFKQFNDKKLFENFRRNITIFEMRGMQIEPVMPMTWQKALDLREKGKVLSYAERKKKFKNYATETFPAVKVTKEVADALCLLEFGRRKLIYERKKYL